MTIHARLLRKVKDTVSGGKAAWAAQSTGEQLAVALALDHAEWISEAGFTLGEAIERLQGEWLAAVVAVSRQVREGTL